MEHLSFVMFYAGTVITLAMLIPYLGAGAAEFMNLTPDQFTRLTTSPAFPNKPSFTFGFEVFAWGFSALYDYIAKIAILLTVSSSIQIVAILFIMWTIGAGVVVFTMIVDALSGLIP